MSALAAPLPLLFVVAAALIDERRRVLVQQRPPGKSLAGLWEFPGGKIDHGETPEAALVRELLEELGVNIAPENLAPATFVSAPLAQAHLVMLVYVVRAWTGDPAPLHASALQWATLDMLAHLPMPPADEPLIPLLKALL